MKLCIDADVASSTEHYRDCYGERGTAPMQGMVEEAK
jgi:hypothetical protein